MTVDVLVRDASAGAVRWSCERLGCCGDPCFYCGAARVGHPGSQAAEDNRGRTTEIGEGRPRETADPLAPLRTLTNGAAPI